ncbi:hypothetical protein PFICI_00463 [Pestalotiopsis fici W106-1]|uniref:Uncharacterized protein n=1 Tax=Pestalotiopsis fici (strain W106-1 / CGMCC3.15140) TaxID=1229662 RepID=W3XKW5_PESFW|nr:uncharacterized protein PFICI_00463 [Pestalotiopsis fici W106-1]ETS86635.1 hypothetical protein PFICI_00463 [Pestalotiopsis fici W106-1]
MSSTNTIQAATPTSLATNNSSGFAGKFRYVNKEKKLATNPNLYHLPPLSDFNDPVTLPVTDIRPSLAQGDASSFKLAVHGFTARREPSELHSAPHKIQSWYNAELIKSVYMPEYHRNLALATEPVIEAENKLLKSGVRWEELKLHYGNGDAETGIPRFALFSVWRSLKTVRRDPLAVASCATFPTSDYVAIDLIQPSGRFIPPHLSQIIDPSNPQGGSSGDDHANDDEAPTHLSNSYLAYEPSGGNSHDWHFISNQEPEDVLIIQLFDNEMEALEAAKQENKSEPSVGGVIHSAFELEGQDDSVEARESLEVRVVAIW